MAVAAAAPGAAPVRGGGEGGWIGGRCWKSDPPCQEVVPLTVEQARALRSAGRLERLRETGAQAQLLDAAPVRCGVVSAASQRLLIAGSSIAVQAARERVEQLLSKELGKELQAHPLDTVALRKSQSRAVEDIEHETGCRIVVDRRPADVLAPKHHKVHLLGDRPQQEDAERLLDRRGLLATLTLPPISTTWINGFSQEVKGERLEVAQAGRSVRRLDGAGRVLRQCVATGDGRVQLYPQGSFWCIAIRKVDGEGSLRGATRLGVAAKPVQGLAPESLLSHPRLSWVLGGGRARSAGGLIPGCTPSLGALPAADFEDLAEGSEVGVLATRAGGLAVFVRQAKHQEWSCLVHWAAGMPDPLECYLVLELAGRVREVELLRHGPPFNVVPEPQVVALTPRFAPCTAAG